MPDLTTMPLDQLIQRCPPLTQSQSPEDEAAWREFLRRALHDRSDAAWDALVARLWPIVLFWIYDQNRDIAPADAELLVQQTIRRFRSTYYSDDVAVRDHAKAIKMFVQKYIAP